MEILNLGILAHVDAGKTSLTERILYTTGAIRSLGSVDKGTTQTDTMELERARGITIKSAVVSFQLGDRKINLIDTPGHADFVAEVERSLRVLDAVVLVVSAVEGVQPQTRKLAQAIQLAGLPLVIFVNKVDRIGARIDPLLDDIRSKLKLRVVPMSSVIGAGTRDVTVAPVDRDDAGWLAVLTDALAETNETVIEEFDRAGGVLSRAYLEAEFRDQIANRAVAPVFFGSAITGVGVSELLIGIRDLISVAPSCPEQPLSAQVFKVLRRPSGERVVYARLFAGELPVRGRIELWRTGVAGEIERFEERVTAIDRFASGATISTEIGEPGDIVCLHGVKNARIGDTIGEAIRAGQPAFPPPSLESVVRPVDPAQVTKLRSALEILADQDPLISLRQRNEAGEISVHLYGEVQKEVLADTLVNEFGVAASFGPSTTICIERPVGTGAHHELLGEGENPWMATIGFRVEPGEVGSGIRYDRELGSLPLAFYRAIEETVFESLGQGVRGWAVTDIAIRLTHAGFSSPLSVAMDFRKLTPLVLQKALVEAGTVVCEPFETMELEIPEDTFGPVCGVLITARGAILNTSREGTTHHISCDLPTAELRGVEQQLPGLTRGDAGWQTSFAGYRPVSGDPPVRDRIGPDPANWTEYLAAMGR